MMVVEQWCCTRWILDYEVSFEMSHKVLFSLPA
jgi:hypothetical protein